MIIYFINHQGGLQALPLQTSTWWRFVLLCLSTTSRYLTLHHQVTCTYMPWQASTIYGWHVNMCHGKPWLYSGWHVYMCHGELVPFFRLYDNATLWCQHNHLATEPGTLWRQPGREGFQEATWSHWMGEVQRPMGDVWVSCKHLLIYYYWPVISKPIIIHIQQISILSSIISQLGEATLQWM